MSNLDVMIPADNECAYEQGWEDCLNIVMRKLKNEISSYQTVGSEHELNWLLDTANSARDMQAAIAWAQDAGMFANHKNPDMRVEGISVGALAELRNGFEP